MENEIIPVVLSAMDAQINDADVQETACGALRNMCAARVVDFVVCLLFLLPCPALCHRCERTQSPRLFARKTCVIFNSFLFYFVFYFVLPGGAQPVRALNSENKRFLRLAGVATRIISCMNVHFYHPEVQIQACGLVRNLGPWDVSRCCLRRKASA